MVFQISLILIALVCAVIAFTIRTITTGVLKIDSSNPEKDIYRFEVYNLDALSKKKYVLMKVKRSSDLSQK